ncbi:hypothetical protein HMPREF3214_01051 [Alloscardovia omnicolens]|nr:hypothetical protein HMPREF3214_01051 [Alloscardovia omnicolens]
MNLSAATQAYIFGLSQALVEQNVEHSTKSRSTSRQSTRSYLHQE